MKVADAMSRNVCLASPDETIGHVAKKMAELDIGFMPVGEMDRLVGSITDRDIAVRAVAQGKTCDARVREVMTQDIKYCFDDEEMDHVLSNMGEIQVRRLPVVNRDKQLVGVIALADAARAHDCERVGTALAGVVQPGGQHSQGETR
jgi:CBS domain-containing protein